MLQMIYTTTTASEINGKTLQKNANITSVSELFVTLEWVMKGEQQLTISGEWKLSPEICFRESPPGVLKVDTADHLIL